MLAARSSTMERELAEPGLAELESLESPAADQGPELSTTQQQQQQQQQA
ncbi:hypothetical protein GCM10029964_020350 [Kibdelosporangium lantanae]